jgi:hypothetical protein
MEYMYLLLSSCIFTGTYTCYFPSQVHALAMYFPAAYHRYCTFTCYFTTAYSHVQCTGFFPASYSEVHVLATFQLHIHRYMYLLLSSCIFTGTCTCYFPAAYSQVHVLATFQLHIHRYMYLLLSSCIFTGICTYHFPATYYRYMYLLLSCCIFTGTCTCYFPAAYLQVSTMSESLVAGFNVNESQGNLGFQMAKDSTTVYLLYYCEIFGIVSWH